jgi:hypothetical protein
MKIPQQYTCTHSSFSCDITGSGHSFLTFSFDFELFGKLCVNLHLSETFFLPRGNWLWEDNSDSSVSL